MVSLSYLSGNTIWIGIYTSSIRIKVERIKLDQNLVKLGKNIRKIL